MWGSPDLNARGRKIEHFLFANGLSLLNRGRTPTFQNQRGDETIVDITMVSAAVVNYVQNWAVSMEATASDHNLIRIQLSTPPPVVKKVRPIRKALLPDFKDDLAARCNDAPAPEPDTLTALEEEGNRLVAFIQESRDEFFPEHDSTSRSSMHYWMNDFIRNKRDGLSESRKKASRQKAKR